MYLVEICQVGYPNGKTMERSSYMFKTLEEAIGFSKSKEVSTPYFDIVSTVYTLIDGRKAIIV